MLAALALLAASASALTGTLTENPVNGICGSTKQGAGYFDFETDAKYSYFYWWSESSNTPDKDPLVLWLTGGPGCSSSLALLTENGPCKVLTNGSVVENPFSWTGNSDMGANVIWVDDIAGAGFSLGPLLVDEHQVAANLVAFLKAFVDAHPSFHGRDLYLTGESYAGHYLSSTSLALVHENPTGLNFKGTMIGNGLVSFAALSTSYPHIVWEWAENVTGHHVVTEEQHNSMLAAEPQCQQLIAACQTDKSKCPDAYQNCLNAFWGPYENNGLNPYNMRLKCDIPGLCYNFTAATALMNDEKVQKELGVRDAPVKWEICNDAANGAMAQYDWANSTEPDIPLVLAAGVRLGVYAGELDFSVNWMASDNWTLGLNWPHKAEFNKEDYKPWTLKDGSEAGLIRGPVAGLSHLRIHNAGHMVPSDQGKAAQEMLFRFIANEL